MPPRDEPASSDLRPDPLGLVLFLVYCALYGTFIGLNAWSPQTMGVVAGGLTVALWYGLGLVVAAIGMALAYVLFHRDRGGRG